MKQHEMTQGVRGKKYSIRLSLVLLAVVLIGTALCIYIWKTTTRKTEEYAITLAKAAQAYLSADLSALLEAKTSNDPHTPSAAIGSGLMAFTAENPCVSYAYLYRLEEGTPAPFRRFDTAGRCARISVLVDNKASDVRNGNAFSNQHGNFD